MITRLTTRSSANAPLAAKGMSTRGKYALVISCWLPMRLAADAGVAFEKNPGGEPDEHEEGIRRSVALDARHAMKQRGEDDHGEPWLSHGPQRAEDRLRIPDSHVTPD